MFVGLLTVGLYQSQKDTQVTNILKNSDIFLLTEVPGGSGSEESACYVGDPGLLLGWGRSLREGNGYPLQYSCPENSMDRGAWQATVHAVAESRT